MKYDSKPTTESLMSGTMKFHLKAAKAFEQFGRKQDAKVARQAAENMRKMIEK